MNAKKKFYSVLFEEGSHQDLSLFLMFFLILVWKAVEHPSSGRRRKSRSNELLAGTVEGVVPGVGLDDKFLSSNTQVAPGEGSETKLSSQRNQHLEDGSSSRCSDRFPGRLM